MHYYKYIIIGSSAAGISALNTVARLDPTAPILCISASNQAPYNTCFLIDVAAGIKSGEQISLRIMSQLVKFMLNTKVISINREKKSIITSDNSEILYQKLAITTGVHPNIPPILGICMAGVFTFHTLENVIAIRAWMHHKKVHKAVVIGAGLTGIECADMLYRSGSAVTIIEKNETLVANQLSIVGAQFLYCHMEALGIQMVCKQRVIEIISNAHGVSAVVLDDGQEIPTDLVIIATGVQPNSELAHQAGLELHHRHIVVNPYMQTADASIVAAGDVVAIHDQTIAMPRYTWADAVQQGARAAHTLAGNLLPYRSIQSNIYSTFFGLHFAVLGIKGAGNSSETTKEDEYIHLSFKNNIPFHVCYLGTRLENIAVLRRAVIQKEILNHR